MKTLKQLQDKQKAEEVLRRIDQETEVCRGILGRLVKKAEQIVVDDDEGELWSDTHRRSDSDTVPLEKIIDKHLAVRGACGLLKDKLKKAGFNRYQILIEGGGEFTYEDSYDFGESGHRTSREKGISLLIVRLEKKK